MLIVIAILFASNITILGLFALETYVDKLDDSNRFKQFWRRHLIGNAPNDIDI